MIIWSSINCPTVICSPTICYFSRETPLVKPTAPRYLLYYICLCDLFSFAFIFRSIKPKIQKKYLAAIYFIWRSICQYLQLSHVCFANFWCRCPKGIDNPFKTSGCEYLLFVCRWCLRSVAWFSYWFDNLGIIIEWNTYRRYIASSFPLWGNTDVVLADITWHERPVFVGD